MGGAVGTGRPAGLDLGEVGDLAGLHHLTHPLQRRQLGDKVSIAGHDRVEGAEEFPYLVDHRLPSHVHQPTTRV
jgi:hypothetical protein